MSENIGGKTKDWPLWEVACEWTKWKILNLVTTKKVSVFFEDILRRSSSTEWHFLHHICQALPQGVALFSFPWSRSFFIQGHLNHSEGSGKESRAAEAAAPAGAQRASSLREFHPILLSFLLPSNVIWKVEFRWLLSYSGITFHETVATWRSVCHSSQLASGFCRFWLRFRSRLITLCSAG